MHTKPIRFLLASLALLMLTACPWNLKGTTPEARADELYAQYTIATERAAAIIQDARVPDSVKQSIQDATRATAPVVEELDAASVALKRVRVEKPEDIPGAILALDELITRAAPLIADYQRRVQQ